MKKNNIAIDGPAGVGKGTTAKGLCKRLNFKYLDTGSMFRAISYWIGKNDLNFTQKDLEKNVKLDFNKKTGHILLNGVDIEKEIRTENVSRKVSIHAKNPIVREFLKKIQQEILRNGGFVVEGRDIGTVILPEAKVKIFLDADIETKAKRRYLQILETGDKANFEEIKEFIKKRDENDRTRTNSPLIQAKDAIFIDNSNLTLEETIDKIYNLWQKQV